jgi:F0F1-type ATP synthase alpha subunit
VGLLIPPVVCATLRYVKSRSDRDLIIMLLQAVDVLTPIGRGQAQLVTGLPGSGKTSLVLDAIIGQKGKGVHCVYAAVGQRYALHSTWHSLVSSANVLLAW